MSVLSTLRNYVRPFSPRPRIHQALYRRSIPLNLPKPIASFTFDDFPRSAYVAGGPLLQRYGGRGTYYASLGLMGTTYPAGDLFTREDLDRLIADGHELGCHTYSHLPARRTDWDVFNSDIAKNRSRMQELFPGHQLQHFSYPGGEVTLRLKRRMGRDTASSRGTYVGINRGSADLDLLFAQKLYQRIPLQHARDVVEDCRARPGWIIFYGHDVSDTPSDCGCTAAYMEEVLKMVSGTCEIMTVGAALNYICGRT